MVVKAALKEREQVELTNGIEVDESYFGPKRVRGKRGRGAGRKVVKSGADIYTDGWKSYSALAV